LKTAIVDRSEEPVEKQNMLFYWLLATDYWLLLSDDALGTF
jgi:hypothetical protein